jgi:hypothetical protein
MENWPIITIRTVGVACIVLAISGYWYTYSTFIALKGHPFGPESPYFKNAYLIVASVCLVFYTLLLIFGSQFLLLILKYKYFFVGLLVVEILYFFSIGLIWRIDNQQIVSSIASATGVANGGLMFQVLTGFILWGPVLLLWSSKKLN